MQKLKEMKYLIGAALILLLSLVGCAGNPKQQTQTILQLCQVRATALTDLAVLNTAGAFTAAQQESIDETVKVTSGVCTGETPITSAAAFTQFRLNLIQLILVAGNQVPQEGVANVK
jgi:hypothetical protein